jgi:hypothetical protein
MTSPIIIFTTAYLTPEFIPYQSECIKKFITVPYEYYVFDNAPTEEIASKNKEMSQYVNANYIRIPQVNKNLNPSVGAGYSVNYSLQYIYNTLIYRGIVMCLDSDLFPMRLFNPIERIGDYSFVGRQDSRGHVIYYTNQFFITNFNKLSDINELDFLPSTVDGHQCDCGGKLYTYFKARPQLIVDHMKNNIYSGRITKDNINSLCPALFKPYYSKELEMLPEAFSEIFEDTFLHYRAGSNWIGHDSNLVFKRSDNLYTFLCNKLIDWNIPSDKDNKYIISTVLYGNSPKYTYNAIINALIAQKVYSGWIIRYYVDESVPADIIATLEKFNNVEIVRMTSVRSPAGAERMLWRFHPASEPDVAVMISRDLDAWLSFRDAVLTKKWIESDKGLHIIRDHCYHSQKIMGGMWGIKRGVFPQMKELCNNFSLSDTYDQGFLANTVYPACIENSIVHVNESQRKMGGAPANGYFPDGGVPFIYAPLIRHYIPGLDIETVNSMNMFRCLHCGIHHSFFIGNMINNITPQLSDVIMRFKA